MSVTLPAENGTMMRMGLTGKDWEKTGGAASNSSTAKALRESNRTRL
jgi:hypothetical protein